jgi:hypothetical protein
MDRDAKKLALALLVAAALLMTLLAVGRSTLLAQTPQASNSEKPQPTATPAAQSSSTKPTSSSSASTTPASTASASQTPAASASVTQQENNAALVWVNTDTGVYHKQRTRWYGKTKCGKYRLEAEAIKASYKPAK